MFFTYGSRNQILDPPISLSFQVPHPPGFLFLPNMTNYVLGGSDDPSLCSQREHSFLQPLAYSFSTLVISPAPHARSCSTCHWPSFSAGCFLGPGQIGNGISLPLGKCFDPKLFTTQVHDLNYCGAISRSIARDLKNLTYAFSPHSSSSSKR